MHSIRSPHLAGRRAALERMKPECGSRGFTTPAAAMCWNPTASVAHFAETNRPPFGAAIDNTCTIARSVGHASATPATFLIDSRGGVTSEFVGDLDHAAVREKVELVLGQT